MNAVPTVGVFIGGAPEDRHAERVVGEMLKYLERIAAEADPALNAVLRAKIGGSVKAQERFIAKLVAAKSPALFGVTYAFGKRCRFTICLSVWEVDENGGATVWWHSALGDGPGREERRSTPVWRISRHALVRMVQRCGCHDAVRLFAAMQAMASTVTAAIVDAQLSSTNSQVLKVPFKYGTAILDWPDGSLVAVVKTVLEEGMK